MTGYNKGCIVFDRYMEQSLKEKTLQKRATTSTEYKVHKNMNLTMTIKGLLSSSKTKNCMFAQALQQHFSCKSSFKLVVVYGTTIKALNFEEQHSYEEAATLIPQQVLASAEVNH